VKTADAIAYFGSVRALADAIRVTPQAIYLWGELVPQRRSFQIQVLSKDALRADPERAAA